MIVGKIKASKYFALVLDCTLCLSHQEQNVLCYFMYIQGTAETPDDFQNEINSYTVLTRPGCLSLDKGQHLSLE